MLACNIPTGIDHDGPIWFHGLIGHLLRVLRNSGFQVFFGTSSRSCILDSYQNVYRVYNYPIDIIDQWHGREANSTPSLCFWSVLGFLGILGCLGASWHHCYSLVTSWHPTWQPWQWEPVGWSHLQKKAEEFTDFSELIETSTEGPLSLKRNSTGFNMIKPSTWWDSMGFKGILWGYQGDLW